jgi:hypothetical protein
MPNWCMNSATISGPIPVLEAMVEAIKQDKMLEHFAPIGDWEYRLAVDMWGTKWEPTDVSLELDYDSETLSLSFDSAWGPPIAAYSTAEERLDVEISASYYEPGMMFIGSYDNGDVATFEIDFEDENWSESIPEDLVDDWGLDSEYENWKEWQDEEE